jgi:glycosyltransferase involved in cell wall biosynthesis
MLEYMVLGKPPICTDVNGAREAIIHGQTGLIVPCADPQALAEAVIRLMEDPAERRRLGAAARDSVRRRFGVKNLTRRYERLLRAL